MNDNQTALSVLRSGRAMEFSTCIRECMVVLATYITVVDTLGTLIECL